MWNAILARVYTLQSVTLQMVEWQQFKWTAISIIFSFLFATLGSILDSQLENLESFSLQHGARIATIIIILILVQNYLWGRQAHISFL